MRTTCRLLHVTSVIWMYALWFILEKTAAQMISMTPSCNDTNLDIRTTCNKRPILLSTSRKSHCKIWDDGCLSDFGDSAHQLLLSTVPCPPPNKVILLCSSFNNIRNKLDCNDMHSILMKCTKQYDINTDEALTCELSKQCNQCEIFSNLFINTKDQCKNVTVMPGSVLTEVALNPTIVVLNPDDIHPHDTTQNDQLAYLSIIPGVLVPYIGIGLLICVCYMKTKRKYEVDNKKMYELEDNRTVESIQPLIKETDCCDGVTSGVQSACAVTVIVTDDTPALENSHNKHTDNGHLTNNDDLSKSVSDLKFIDEDPPHFRHKGESDMNIDPHEIIRTSQSSIITNELERQT